jgi:hypothetical protein
MSRVVIVAVLRSSSRTGSGVPSYAKRRIPSTVPAPARSNTTIWPGAEAPGDVSPSIRR